MSTRPRGLRKEVRKGANRPAQVQNHQSGGQILHRTLAIQDIIYISCSTHWLKRQVHFLVLSEGVLEGLSRDFRSGAGSRRGSDGGRSIEQYRLSTLVRRRADLLRQGCRLVLTGYAAGFREHHVSMHRLLDGLEIPHVYRDGPQRKHHWQSGWLEESVSMLAERCGTRMPEQP